MNATTLTAATTVALPITAEQLRVLVRSLEARYPEAGERVQHAAALVLFRPMARLSPSAWQVTSERDDRTYLVRPESWGGYCTCADHQRRGYLSPCKHRLAVMLAEAAERVETDAEQRRLAARPVPDIDVCGVPIPFALTERAQAIVDAHRQRQAARCPTCGEYKQHGDLYCAGSRCAAAPVAVGA